MSDAKVQFVTLDDPKGREQAFSFACPLWDRRCGDLVIAGRTDLPRDGQGKNGGVPQWDWDGNREAPTFSPSINCGGCWHGYIERGRCVSVAKQDEPEPAARTRA